MSEWIGKKLRYRDSKVINKVVDQKDGMLYLDDNAVIPMNRVASLYEEVRNNNGSIDPEEFFSRGTSVLANLGEQLKRIDTQQVNYNTSIPSIDNNRDGKQRDTILESRPLRQYEEGSLGLYVPPVKKVPNVNDLKGNLHGITIPEEYMESIQRDTGGEVTRINTDDDDSNYRPGLNNQNKYKDNNGYNRNGITENNSSRSKLKKTTSITLKLEIVEMVPKIDAIRSFNDLYDEPIIELLAKEIVEKYINDPLLLEEMIKEKLEAIVFPKKRRPKKKKRKPTAKKVIKLNENTLQ